MQWCDQARNTWRKAQAAEDRQGRIAAIVQSIAAGKKWHAVYLAVTHASAQFERDARAQTRS
eukprot:12521031-Alexandrium_andersonii.AAC.1